MRKFLVFDIGGTLIKYGVISENTRFFEKGEIPTEAHLGGKEVIKRVIKICEEYIKSNDIKGICISTAGQVDSQKGEIIYASSLIPEYTGMPIKQILEDYFNIPVEVENDVNCAGLAESWVGKGKNARSMFCLTIGTGIGGSYIIDNKLHTGYSFSGGEIGYIPIEGSQFQELASTRTLVRRVSELKGIPEDEMNGKKIFHLAKQGDEICIQEIKRLVYYLSKGIATITYMMNPEMIVIGGGITNQKEYLYPLIMEELKKDIIPSILAKTKIEIAGKLNDAGMIGALRHFLLQEALQPFNRIITMIESNKHKLTKGENVIAQYITFNLNEVPNYTISEMAQKIGVSESMITRFCKKLNIESYSKFRMMAKEAIVSTHIHDKTNSNSYESVKEGYVNIFNKIHVLNHPKILSSLVEKLIHSDRIFLYGTGEISNILHQIKFKLMKLGIPVDTFTTPYQMQMSTNLLQSNSFVIGISLSGYNSDVLHMLKQAKQKQAVTIGITSQRDSPISNESDLSILIPMENYVQHVKSSISEISTLYLFDILFKEIQDVIIKK
ncbi:ROK family protein [Caldibacillus thermoamylovorans]|uniref:ROK family protein n=1 Tax=Caldibacillus thermoamylovorans TaxID=35841 RepID=UPI00203BFE91|nr:ROK family protein [Caldibacillus thermoamylovorans]MCM3478556.1 ROK family protein [Caldibacillus thermoamylovorans]